MRESMRILLMCYSPKHFLGFPERLFSFGDEAANGQNKTERLQGGGLVILCVLPAGNVEAVSACSFRLHQVADEAADNRQVLQKNAFFHPCCISASDLASEL